MNDIVEIREGNKLIKTIEKNEIINHLKKAIENDFQKSGLSVANYSLQFLNKIPELIFIISIQDLDNFLKKMSTGGGMSFDEFVSTFNGWKSDSNGGRTNQIDIVTLIYNVYIALKQGWIKLAYKGGGNYMVKARKYTTKPKSVTKSSSKKPVKKQAKATVNKK
jgi:hypothetical protein